MRIFSLIHARNLEFIRDRSAFGWGIMMPILLLLVFSIVFSEDNLEVYKIAVKLPDGQTLETVQDIEFLQTKFVRFYQIDMIEKSLPKVARHKVDMLLDLSTIPAKYYTNSTSPNGYLIEKILLSSRLLATKEAVVGKQVRYLDWVVPGVLGMNIMFGCLFGVGWVIVRYRKNGYLKRLHATPITAFEFILAQVVSRLFVTLIVASFLFIGAKWLIGFEMLGSALDLLVITILSIVSLISFGLIISSRTSSEELSSGLLNFVAFPMMLLSETWFSLEGSPDWVQTTAQFFPMTHFMDASRGIILDGKGLMDLLPQIIILSSMSVLFLAIGSYFFRWDSSN